MGPLRRHGGARHLGSMNNRVATLVALACVLAAPAAPTQEPRPAPIPEAELVRRLSGALDSLSALDRFSGVVVLAQGDRRVFARAYGMADREARRSNDLETGFNIGSINKVLTQLAVRQLEAAGRLSSDSPLVRYWPDYPNPDVARQVTIRQLLGHTSGVGGDIFAAPPGGTRHDLRHNRDVVPLFAREPLQFAPGSRQQYSNAGYVILGEVIARVSGEDYYDYVRRHITGPAGMARTAHFAVDSLPPNTAIGYMRGPEAAADAPLHPNTDYLPGRGSAAGGGYSTARDLLAFLAASRSGRIPGLPAPRGGLGVFGGAPGLNAGLLGDLPGGYDLVVLANLDPTAAMDVARLVRSWLGLGPAN